jgi:hypothetical protein
MIKEMARKIINRVKSSYEKYQLRGAIKEIMRNYGLRTISLANYNKWSGAEDVNGIHSVKYDIMNGYIHMHSFKDDGRCGAPYESIDVNVYQNVYNTIQHILKTEETIPAKVKRNILVKVNR